jgi:hypothetical protein
MFSTPVNTLAERAIFMRLLARVHTAPHLAGFKASSVALNGALHADTDEHAPFGPPRQIVLVRANHICRRRVPSLLEHVGVEESPNEAGRGWRRGAAWDDTDARSILDRLKAAAAAGGFVALGAAGQPAAVLDDAVRDTPDMTNDGADDACREVPALV